MNVLVTGAAGYVGSVCAEVLVRQGHRVIALDDLSQGHRAARFQRVAISSAATFSIRIVWIVSSTRLEFTPEIMHFAGEILVEKSAREPKYFLSRQCGWRNSFAGRDDPALRVNKMVFSSSAAVYGEPRQVPIPENHPTVPINPYGQTKLLFENILTDYARYAGLRHISLRYFNAAGASQERGEAHRTETHIIPKILDAATGAIPHFEVRGTDYSTPDGTCVRDYVHVLDIAEAHVLALANIESVSGEAFNVGSNRGYSIREVVETARRVTGAIRN